MDLENLHDPLTDWSAPEIAGVAAFLVGRMMPDLCRKGVTPDDVKRRIDEYSKKLAEVI